MAGHGFISLQQRHRQQKQQQQVGQKSIGCLLTSHCADFIKNTLFAMYHCQLMNFCQMKFFYCHKAPDYFNYLCGVIQKSNIILMNGTLSLSLSLSISIHHFELDDMLSTTAYTRISRLRMYTQIDLDW